MPRKFAFLRNLLACLLLSGLLAGTYPALAQTTPPATSPPATSPQQKGKADLEGINKSCPPPQAEMMKKEPDKPAKKSPGSGRLGGQTIRKDEGQEEP